MPKPRARHTFLLLPVLAGCGASTSAPESVVTYDSAGIHVVYSARPVWTDADRWELAPAPTVTIGQRDGPPEQLLYQVRAAVRLDDGRIVIANAGSDELRFYDSRGRHLAKAGGSGEGPGEFRFLSGLEVIGGDSLAAFDWRLQRISVFDAAGRFARSFVVPPFDGRANSIFEGVLGDDTFIMNSSTVYRAEDERRGLVRDTVTYFAVDREGAFLGAVTRYPGTEVYEPPPASGYVVMSFPFGKSSTVAAGRDVLFLGSADRFEVEVYSATGELRRIFRRAHDPIPVTDEDVESFVQLRIEDVSDPGRRRVLENLYRGQPHPKTMPAHGEFLVDTQGNLWVSAYRGPLFQPSADRPISWSVFSPDGHWLGEVRIPSNLTILEIGDAYVLARATDEMDVERVELYRLIKGASTTTDTP